MDFLHIQRRPNDTEKNFKSFIDHKLKNGERILKKFQNLFFAKNGRGPPTPPHGDPKVLRNYPKCLLIISYKIAKEF